MGTGRVGRGCLASLLVLVVLAVAAALLVRRALDPEALRRGAEARLSSALGQPVSIGRMNVSLWPVPAVEGHAISIGAGASAGAPSVSLAGLRILPRLSSLFSRPIVVERVELQGLVLRALRDAQGKWLLPLPSTGDGGGSTDLAAVDIGRAVLHDGSLLVIDQAGRWHGTQPPGIRRVEAAMVLEGGAARLESLSAAVGRSTLSGRGTVSANGLRLSLEWQSLRSVDLPEVFALLAAESPAGLAVEGDKPLSVELTIDASGTPSAQGRLAASKLAFGTLTVTSLAAPLRLAGNRLTLNPLTFALYGGTQRGTLTANTGVTPVAWALESALDGVDVNQLLSSNTAAKNKLSGTGRMRANLRGTMSEPIERTMTGTVAIEVANGVVRDFPLVGALNGTLKLGTSSDDRDLRFERLSGTLRVANAAMTTDDMLATSGDLTLNAAGTLRFDLGLDLTGTARFTRAKSDDLVRRAKHLGGLRNPDGEIEVPFTVSGTVSNPAFSIQMEKVLERAAGKELRRQLNRRLKDLIKIR